MPTLTWIVLKRVADVLDREPDHVTTVPWIPQAPN